jgi:hypothetical protein
LKNVCVLAICVLLFLFFVSPSVPVLAQAASSAIIGLPVERNGVRFETWLASPKIVIPDKSVSYENQKVTVLFSVRVTNLTPEPIRFDPFTLRMILTGPDGKEVECGFGIVGGLQSPQEEDYLVLKPGISEVVSRPSSL